MLFKDYNQNFKFKNRIVMAPMCMYQADNFGTVSPFHLTHYGARAIGGASCIIVEATAVEARGRITENDLCIYSDEHISGLKRLAANIKRFDSIAGIQLAHAGRKSNTKGGIIAPSAISFHEMKTPTEMSNDDILTVIQAFKFAAMRANKAGFDLIEIHAAHGYLINQFLSNITNKRTDAYGGSLDNRLRFLSSILDAVAEVWPKEKILGIRISAEEFSDEGNHVNDLIYVINQLKHKGIDYVNVSSGGVIPAKITVFPGYQLDYAKQIKQETNLPVIGGGLITSGIQANDALIDNNIDFIYFGRELLRNPHFPRNAAKELGVDFKVHPAYIRAN